MIGEPQPLPSRRHTRQHRQRRVAPPSSRACSSGSIARIRPAPRRPGSTAPRLPRTRPGSTVIRSVSNRTGTSNSKPAVTCASAAGATAKPIRPVAASTVNPVPSASSTPATATRTVPATGFAIGRT